MIARTPRFLHAHSVGIRLVAVALTAGLGACGTQYTPAPGGGVAPFDIGGLSDSGLPTDTGASDTSATQDSAAGSDAADATGTDTGPAVDTAGCVPTNPPTEKCDNVDNDCNGKTDDTACDDGNPCTDQTCDGAKGAAGEDGCAYSLPVGSPCDDGSKCTTGDACQNGICNPGQKKNCDDNNTCTVDACKSDTGACENLYLGDGKFCNDGKNCTNNDLCADGKCVGKASAQCDDGNPCTVDDCNDAGACTNKSKDDLPCDDLNPCTSNDKCFFGACTGGDLTVCDDKKPCTDDFCDPKQGGCVYKPKLLGSPCSDGLCSVGGSCDQTGNCVGQKQLCDDGKTCTVDSCDPQTGKCTNTGLAVGTPCDDGEACTTGESCDAAGQCTPPAGQKGCNDGNPCTEDLCDVATKSCSNKVKTGPCDDGDACTSGEVCVTGKCVTGAAPKSSLVAGTGAAKYQDGNGQAASFNLPRGIHRSPDGTLVIADRSNHRVRAINAQGQVSTVAGSGTKGFLNGPGNSARFSSPEDVATGPDGTVYVADSANHRIRSVSTKGQVDTKAGNGSATWKDGPGASASFNNPQGVAVDAKGQVFVADSYNHRIRRIDVNGVVTTVAGSGSAGFAEGKAAAAKFNYPYGLDVAGDGKIYVADGNNHRVRVISTSGVVTTFAGTGTKASVDGALATAQFATPADVFMLKSGDLAVAEKDGHRVRLIKKTGLVLTVAGNGTAAYKEGAGSAAQLNQPWGIAGDGAGNLFVADSANNRIRRFDGGVKGCDDGNACTLDTCNTKLGACQHDTLKAGDACDDGSACSTGDTCDAVGQCKGKTKDCNDNSPCTTDSCNAFTGQCEYVALTKACNDGDACTLADVCVGGKCVSGAGDVVNFCGSGTAGYTDGAPTSARFYYPEDVAADAAGNVYVADRNNHRIRKITANGTASVLAGTGSSSYLDGAGNVARFYYPAGVAVDSKGVVYVADSYNHRIRKVQANGTTSTLAGSSSGWQDGVGTSARFSYPEGVDVDAGGNVYVADRANQRIRKITPSGAVTTLAGTGSSGFVDGPAKSAKFSNPYDVAFGPQGDVFVADYNNQRVRRIAPDGSVTTFAGNGSKGTSDGKGQGASLSGPRALAVDPLGNLLLADRDGSMIRRITADGVVFTLAGKAGAGYVNGKPATAKFNNPSGIAVGQDGSVYVADRSNHRVRKLKPTQTLCNDGDSCTTDLCDKTTGKCDFKKIGSGGKCEDGDACTVGETCSLAGKCAGGKPKVCSDGNPCTTDQCNSFSGGCFFAPAQAVCTDGQFCTVNDRCVDGKCVGDLSDVYTMAGSTAGFVDAAGPKAKFNAPWDVAFDAKGNVFVADRSNHRIRKVAANGLVTTLAGQSSASYLEGTGASARFYYPSGVAVDKSGNVVVADTYNNRIRSVSPGGKTSLIAGQSSYGYTNGKGASARFYRPEGVAVDRNTGMIYVADTYNHRIRRVDPAGNVTLVAGSGSASYLDGAATSARFYYPRDVDVSSKGDIYVADGNNHMIRRIAAKGFAVTTFAGQKSNGFANGKGGSAKFYYPYGLAFGPDDVLYVGDQSNHRVRRVLPDGTVDVFAGSGQYGFLDESADLAKFYNLHGLDVDSAGNMVIADYNNHRIRRINSPYKSCGDGTECTVNACDEANDKCTTEKAKDFTSCTDGNLCLEGALCNSGKCVGGVDKNQSGGCDDKNACTVDSCNKSTGACVYKPAPGCVAHRRVFLSSAIYTGNLGGIDGGHAKCQALADAAGLGGKWFAWLSTYQTWPATYFDKSPYPYKLLDGKTVALNWNDLVDGALDNGINLNEKGQLINSTNSSSNSYCGSSIRPKVHTGTTTAGTRMSSSSIYMCNRWQTSSSSSSYRTYSGRAGATNSQWTQGCTSDRCYSSYQGHLYCFEQTNFWSKQNP